MIVCTLEARGPRDSPQQRNAVCHDYFQLNPLAEIHLRCCHLLEKSIIERKSYLEFFPIIFNSFAMSSEIILSENIYRKGGSNNLNWIVKSQQLNQPPP